MKRRRQINERGLYGNPGVTPLSKVNPRAANAVVQGGNKDGSETDDKVSAKKVEIPARSLKPAQTEIIPGKALGLAVAYLLRGKPDLTDLGAIVSGDNYIMDGHHRWAAAFLIDPSTKLKVTKIDLPGEDLVTVLNYMTVGKVGILRGNPGKGNVADFTSSKISPILNDFMQNGSGGQFPVSAEEYMTAMSKVKGSGGDPFKGRDLLLKNADLLPKKIMPGAPARVDMPVINPNKVAVVASLIKNGNIDIHAPYSPEVKSSMGIRENRRAGMRKKFTSIRESVQGYNGGVFDSLDKARVVAQKISKDEGVAQHVNELGNGRYKVSDWYDYETTVASYSYGRPI